MNLSSARIPVSAFLLSMALAASSQASLGESRPRLAKALVYKGPGSCDEGCSDAAALMAQRAGLNPVFVGPSEKDPKLFEGAVVWIQPGGSSRTIGRNMVPELKTLIKDFVRGGGAYVGFCAGGFYATAKIGELEDEGLGLIEGRTAVYTKTDLDAVVLPARWMTRQGQADRYIYWEGGPVFYPPAQAPGPEVMAYYPDGSVLSVRAAYGAGRVYVTGGHPEAPQFWRDYYKLADPDGLDYDVAVSMIRWAARLRSTE